ncbi:MAG TPA: SOS response-associated peptidase [Myxococcales bacterium]
MCGRITLTTPDVQAVAAMVEARVSPEDAALYRPRYNAAPTDRHWIVEPGAAGRVLLPAVWGFPSSTGLLINARAESAERLPGFREAFARRRVVVPADGFFEWTGPRDHRQPIWFRPRGGGLLYLAGLAEQLPDGRIAFVVLTTDAAGPVARVHDRMPVLLPKERVQAWLEKPDSGLLIPAPEDFLTATEVSSRVNDVSNDDPACLEEPRRQQLTLF